MGHDPSQEEVLQREEAVSFLTSLYTPLVSFFLSLSYFSSRLSYWARNEIDNILTVSLICLHVS
jgi:hypothetical protein